MAREIRISIDDDEVFERMKARKRDLDLSWEEVLYRGLREGSADGGGAAGSAGEQQYGSHAPADAGPGHGRGHEDPWDRWAEDLEASIRRKVSESLRSSFGAAGIEVPEPPDTGLED